MKVIKDGRLTAIASYLFYFYIIISGVIIINNLSYINMYFVLLIYFIVLLIGGYARLGALGGRLWLPPLFGYATWPKDKGGIWQSNYKETKFEKLLDNILLGIIVFPAILILLFDGNKNLVKYLWHYFYFLTAVTFVTTIIFIYSVYKEYQRTKE